MKLGEWEGKDEGFGIIIMRQRFLEGEASMEERKEEAGLGREQRRER